MTIRPTFVTVSNLMYATHLTSQAVCSLSTLHYSLLRSISES